VLTLWCPSWPVVAAGATPGTPVAVLRANVVIAASPSAQAEGVHPGVRRREAQRTCPGLVVVDHDPGRDARAFEPVLHAVERFTPLVELTRPGACTFTTRGPSRYHGGDTALAVLVARAAAEVLGAVGVAVAGLPGVGVADGRFTALVAARRAATPAAGPSPPIVVVDRGESPAYLAPDPVGALADPELTGALSSVEAAERAALVDLLPRLGLRTLGAFAALDTADVAARFGTVGRLVHRLAAGLDERPPAARRPPAELTVSLELDPPAQQVGPVVFAAKHLADVLHARLAADGLAATRVIVQAETEHGEHHERGWRGDGALGPAAIAERVRWQLDGWAQGPTAPTGGITVVRLVPDEVVADTGRQLGFWGGLTQADERATRAVARLVGVCGPEAVTVPEWRGGRDPADLVALVPAAGVELTGRSRAVGPSSLAGPWPGRVPTPTPSLVHPEPIPVEVHDADGQLVTVSGRGLASAPPARLVLGGRSHDVVAWAGPWPVEERWWDPVNRRRRARFQLVTERGAAYLAVLEGGAWAVTATYG
jgi:protein ImuB